MSENNKKGEPQAEAPQLENKKPQGIHTNEPNVNLLSLTGKKFKQHCEINLKGLTENRSHGNFNATYISWANAIKLLNTEIGGIAVDFERDNSGSFCHALDIGDGNPTFYLLPFLTNGKSTTPVMFFPITDNRFNPIKYPSVRDVNDSMQRAKAKIIAHYTGLGLPCYIGEDIPDQEIINHDLAIPESAKVESKKTKNVAKGHIASKSFAIDESDRIYLNAKYSEREEVKSLGARWCKENKKWYITKKQLEENPKFENWVKITAEDIVVRDNQTDASLDVQDQVDEELYGEDEENAPF